MRNVLRILAIGSTTLVAAAVSAQIITPPVANAPPVFDVSQLPAFKGTVQQFTMTPRGDIDGLMFSDGTEVKLPPHLTADIVAAIKIGDAVTVHGLKAAKLPLIAASAVTNVRSGATVVDNGPQGKKGHGSGGSTDSPRTVVLQSDLLGRVKVTLHGRKGEVNGALLDDGTVLRLPPPEAARYSAMLTPGQALAARGTLISSPYGKVLDVRGIGPTLDKLSEVQGPPPGKKGPKGPKG